MKLRLLITGVLLCSIFFTATAQKDIPQGSILLGGDISYVSSTYKDNINSTKSNGFNISPSVGIAVKKNLFVGINAGIGIYKNAYGNNPPFTDSTRYHSYSYGVYIRQYKPLKNNFYLFLQGNLGGFNGKRTWENVNSSDNYQKDMGVNLSLTPGVSYAFNSRLQMEAGFNSLFGLNYSKNKNWNSQSSVGVQESTNFAVYTSLNNFNSQLYLGFRLLLQKKDKGNATAKNQG